MTMSLERIRLYRSRHPSSVRIVSGSVVDSAEKTSTRR
jgi:hypothetical protein